MAEENEEQVNENESETEETESAPPAVASKKKILLLLLPIFLVVGTVIGLYFSGVADSFLTMGGSEDSKGASKDNKQNASAIFFDVPEIVVNIAVKPDQKPIYFKIKVALEMSSAADSEQAERMLPRIIDSLQFYLREMRLEEIQGSVGTYRLKEEIQNRLNRILSPVKIADVLFKDILIQ